MVDSLRTARVSVVREPVLTPERILDAVSEQLERSGIAGLRLRDVAERLNVSVPSLYRFFEDREAMIAAAYVRDFSLQTFVDIDELQGGLREGRDRGGLRARASGASSWTSSATSAARTAGASSPPWPPLATTPCSWSRSPRSRPSSRSRWPSCTPQAKDRGWVTTPDQPARLRLRRPGPRHGAPVRRRGARSRASPSEDFTDVFVLFHRALTS